MRKIILILLSLCCCLLSLSGGTNASAAVPQVQTVLSVDYPHGDMWLCEQFCNSDLGLPRVPGQLAPTYSITMQVRCCSPDWGREASHPAISVKGVGSLKAASRLSYPETIAGSHAVEYYIYRLRRLLI